MSSSPLVDPWLGRYLGERQRYRLDKRLGAGGMAEVFLAIDTLLEQPVALKLLNEKLAAGEMRRRFEREVTLCAALTSEHIVRVSDHGVTPEGYPFFVMEYLRGQTLRQLLSREKRLSVERTVSIMAQVCEGLHLAHQGINLRQPGTASSEHVKIVHRDLKPDNIFLVPMALGELVKILDFGIAKIRSDEADSNATKVFLGTYRYAAPEQFEIGKNLDERADIYSLGMILYEMLSGTDPYGFGGLVHQVSGGTWAVAHLSKPVIPLRTQPGCEQLSLELDEITTRCLQKDPEQRFSCVKELSTALQAAIGLRSQPSISPASEAIPSVDITRLASPTQSYLQASTFQDDTVLLTQNVASVFNIPSESPLPRSLLRQPIVFWAGALVAGVVALGIGAYYSAQFSVSSELGAENSFVQGASAAFQPGLKEKQPAVETSEAVSVKSLTGHSDTVWAVAIAPDSQTLVSGSFDKTIRLWDRETGAVLRILSGHTDAVRAVTVSTDGQTLASGSSDKTIKIWRLQTGELLRTLSGHQGPVWSVAISPDGKTLASGSYDGTVKLWNLQTGKLLRTLSGHVEAVRSVVISNDGQILASGSWDKTIKIWNLQTGELLHTLAGHLDRVVSVALAPSGETIASGSLDQTIKIWSVETGRPLKTLSEHTAWVISVAFSSDEKTIISGSRDKTVKIWQKF